MSATRYALTAPAQLSREIRKSKFIANAANTTSEEAAIEFLERMSDAAATHNCWAWRIGERYRSSDDGEPAGTAGKPILQAIDGQSLDNVTVVVTRWFGGIKLGAGGLMRAYGGCAAGCLRQASKSELVETAHVEFAVEFSVLPTLHARLRALAATINAEDFAEAGAIVRIGLPVARLAELHSLLADLTRGRSEIRLLD
ncbi:MAG: IMPACT family protein [Rudaea sp.]|nr:IMPACT family protein [Rudaea sp.]